MRQIKCDQCGETKEGDALSPPRGWYRILTSSKVDAFYASQERRSATTSFDFCSWSCLVKWGRGE